MSVPFLRSPFNYDREAASNESGLCCVGASRTQQNFKDECDINVIMRKYSDLDTVPKGVRIPQYGDFSGVSDYHSAANALALARESFDAMPARVRAKFKNDPEAFVEFCSAPENGDELVALGLADRRPVAPPVAPVAPPGAPVASPGAPVAPPGADERN